MRRDYTIASVLGTVAGADPYALGSRHGTSAGTFVLG